MKRLSQTGIVFVVIFFSCCQAKESVPKRATCDTQYTICWDTKNVYYPEANIQKLTQHKREPDLDVLSKYYGAIKSHDFQTAVDMRITPYNYTSFVNNYTTLKDLKLYNIQKISDHTYSFMVDMTDAKGTASYTVTKKITKNKLVDIGGTKKITPEFPQEFSFANMQNYFFSKEKKLFINIAPIGDWICNFRANKDYVALKLPKCSKLAKLQMKEAILYTILPKDLPSFALYQDMSGPYDPAVTPQKGVKVVVLPNTLKLSLQDAKGLAQNGESGYQVQAVSDKYIFLIRRCGTGLGKAVACLAIKENLEKTVKVK